MMVYGLSSLRYAHAGYTAASTISRPSRYSRTEIALRFLPAKSQVVSYSICLQPLSSGHCWNNSLTQSTNTRTLGDRWRLCIYTTEIGNGGGVHCDRTSLSSPDSM